MVVARKTKGSKPVKKATTAAAKAAPATAPMGTTLAAPMTPNVWDKPRDVAADAKDKMVPPAEKPWEKPKDVS